MTSEPRAIPRRRPLLLPALLAALAVAGLLATATPARALQWYEHYEAGLASEARGAWQEALASFQEAERFRPDPAERVRTYGNRFLFGYDPPFHAARCLVELGRGDEARAALARSTAAGVTPEAARAALAARIDSLARRKPDGQPAATASPSGPSGSNQAVGPPATPSAAAVDRTAGEPGSADARARLVVESTPPGASVTVDGRPVGRTPIDGVEVAPGDRRIRVSGAVLGEGWGSWEQTLDAQPGERIHVDVALSRPPPPSAAPSSQEGAGAPAAGGGTGGTSGGRTDAGEARDQGEAGAGVPERPNGEAGPAPPEPPAAAGAGGGDPPSASPSDLTDDGADGGTDGGAGADGAGTLRRAADENAGSGAGEPGATGESGPTEPTASDAGSGRSPEPADGGAAAFPGRPVLAAAAVVTLLVVAVVAWWLGRGRRPRGGAPAGRGTGGTGGIGQQVGGYRIEAVLGRGGMATTYRAERLSDRRAVALKIPHETGDPTYLERFLREGRLGETLHHPGIVRIIEAGTTGDGERGAASGAADSDTGGAGPAAPRAEILGGERPFLAMELLPGRTLREALDEAAAAGEPLAIERCLEIVVEIAEALDYAHGKGVIHRDLKPENVMVLPDGGLKVMDFGVARVEGQPGLTTSRFFFGSPVYAAPELVDPKSIDRRSDLYSLGVLLYELLEGEPPFVHESIFKLLEMHQNAPLPAPGELPRALPPSLWQVVARLLAKDREERFGSAQELLVELHRLVSAPTSPS